MASQDKDESAQFQEPISPTSSNDATTTTSSESAKPSITGLLKNAVSAPPTEELVNEEPEMEDAIQAVGDDGGEKGR